MILSRILFDLGQIVAAFLSVGSAPLNGTEPIHFIKCCCDKGLLILEEVHILRFWRIIEGVILMSTLRTNRCVAFTQTYIYFVYAV